MKEIFKSRPVMWSAIAIIGLITVISSSRYRRIKDLVWDDTKMTDIIGTVSEVSYSNGKTSVVLQRYILSGDSADDISKIINEYSKPFYIKDKATVTFDGLFDVDPGQEITASGRVYLYPSATNPGEFDGRRYYLGRQKIIQIKADSIRITDDRRSHFILNLRSYRTKAGEVFLKYLSNEDAGIMTAMLLGDRSLLSQRDKELFREGGIMHIISISGMHISFLGGLVESLIKLIPLQTLYKGYRIENGRLYNDKKSRFFFIMSKTITMIVPIAFIGIYLAMIPYSPSALRAAIMFALSQLAKGVGKASDMGTDMSLAACFTLILNPYACLDSGFLLSYAAILGIAIVSPVFHRFRKGYSSAAEKMLGSIPISASTLPFLMNSYYEIPIFAPVISPAVLPVSSVLLGLGILLVLCGNCFEPVPCVISYMITSVLFVLRILCGVTALMPGNMMTTGHRSVLRVILYLAVLYGGSLYMQSVKRKFWIRGHKLSNYARRHEGIAIDSIRKKEKRIYGRKMIIYTVIMICNLFCLLLPNSKKNAVTFLDVGQGDCIVMEYDGLVCVIDGGSSDKTKVGSRIISRFLMYEGYKKADVWILTHPDRDHISGFVELGREGITADTIMIPKALEESFIKECGEISDAKNMILLDGGMNFGDKDVRLNVVSPSFNLKYEDDNDASLCIVAECGTGCRFIFMADAGQKAEKEVENFLDGKEKVMTVLKVAHHGSAIGTNSKDFINAISPDIAVISCGVNNRYGHPHIETVNYLENAGSRIHRTDRDGAVTINFDAK